CREKHPPTHHWTTSSARASGVRAGRRCRHTAETAACAVAAPTSADRRTRTTTPAHDGLDIVPPPSEARTPPDALCPEPQRVYLPRPSSPARAARRANRIGVPLSSPEPRLEWSRMTLPRPSQGRQSLTLPVGPLPRPVALGRRRVPARPAS